VGGRLFADPQWLFADPQRLSADPDRGAVYGPDTTT
jgi:hypothetical protein